MNRILTVVLAAASLVLVSCETCKTKKGDSCCKEGSAASCCAKPCKVAGHKH